MHWSRSSLVLAVGTAWAAACGGSAFTTTGTGNGDGGSEGGSGGEASSGGASGGASTGSGSTSGSGGSSGASSGASSGGSSEAGVGEAGASSGGGRDGGAGDGGIPVGPCPAAAPAVSSTCSHDGLTCEWGSKNVPDCDVVATCTAGLWVLQKIGLDCTSGANCPTAKPTELATCTAAMTCDYTGNRCECSAGSPPSNVLHWYCQAPGTGCPLPRPRLGATCAPAPGLSCDYGSCVIPGGNTEDCTDAGIWASGSVGCPG